MKLGCCADKSTIEAPSHASTIYVCSKCLINLSLFSLHNRVCYILYAFMYDVSISSCFTQYQVPTTCHNSTGLEELLFGFKGGALLYIKCKILLRIECGASLKNFALVCHWDWCDSSKCTKKCHAKFQFILTVLASFNGITIKFMMYQFFFFPYSSDLTQRKRSCWARNHVLLPYILTLFDDFAKCWHGKKSE